MSPSSSTPVDVAERVLRLLDEGRYTATYKQAVLVALIDLSLESLEHSGAPREMVTTKQLAEKIVQLYWPHTRVWSFGEEGRVLVQNAAGSGATRDRGGGIVAKIRGFREAAEAAGAPMGTSLATARSLAPEAHRRLVDEVEWTLIEMPLPKLQRIGERNTEWLYAIAWRDVGERDPAHRAKPGVSEGQVRAYQRGAPSDFDNRIHLRPGVGEAFVRLHAMLRPFILQHWVAQVERLNRLDRQDLFGFLFGQGREDTSPIRRPLVELQAGRCFYCDGVFGDEVHVDHFVPWARHPEQGLYNLVATDARCNGAKKDYLASVVHVERWRRRARESREALEQIARAQRWDSGEERVLGVARSIYLSQPEEMLLWRRAKEFERCDTAALRRVLAA